MAPCVLLLLLFLCEAASAEDPVKVKPGDNVTLTCQPADPNIIVVQWTRTDLKSEYVFLYRDGNKKPDTNQQCSFFEGRVQLVDRDLKDGDVSLILKNVSSSDEGTYECRVVGDSRRKKRAIIKTEPIRRVRLHVTGSDHGAMKDGEKEEGDYTRMYPGVTAAGFLVCLSVVGLFVFRKYKRHLNNEPEAAAADEAESVELNMLQT